MLQACSLILGFLAVVFTPTAQDQSINFQLPEQAPYAIGWGTLALINAGLAQSKNRSGLAWFLVSLVLGPIATFLIVVLDAVEKK
jgi:hypothetical protein